MNKSDSQTALMLEFTTEKDITITILNMLKKIVKMEKRIKVSVEFIIGKSKDYKQLFQN